MKLAPIEYQLDEWELPDHRFVTGTLEIDIDHTDEMPYIWAYDVKIWCKATDIVVHHHFQHGRPDNHLAATYLRKELHDDKKLMDDIFDACCVEAMWD